MKVYNYRKYNQERAGVVRGRTDASQAPSENSRAISSRELRPWCIVCVRGTHLAHTQESQQRIALLADVPQTLFAGTGVLTRNHPHVGADLLATSNRVGVPMINTWASAVSGPTPG